MKYFPFFAAMLVFAACASPKKSAVAKSPIAKAVAQSPVFEQGFTGFYLKDLASGAVLADLNGSRLFTPASNTKILTLFSSLAALGPRLPAFQWQSDGNTFFVRGTGDPSFLHPSLGRLSSAFSTLKNRPEPIVCLVDQRFFDRRFGAGWMWDDASEPYQCERAAMPLFGGEMQAKGAEPKISPRLLGGQPHPSDDPFLAKGELRRDEFSNRLEVRPETVFPNDFEQFMPIRWEPGLLEKLLQDTLRTKKVRSATAAEASLLNPKSWQTEFGAPTDSILKAMMLPSDNFLGDQLLLAVAGILTDSLGVEIGIAEIKKRHFPTDRLRWVDGSGLSRYNLFAPHFLVDVLEKLWKTQPRERLLNLFPVGGERGTIRDWYRNPDGGAAYVFAKTGTMSGAHSLSGFVRTARGRWLAFSFMHDHFVGPSKPYKEEMQRVLELIYRS